MPLDLHIKFSYSVTATLTTGEVINHSGDTSILDYEDGEYWDDGLVFAKAFTSSMDHFYSSYIDKENRKLADIKITVKDLDYEVRIT
jgi:hypothetical protein